MSKHYIYEIFGKKIGATNNIERRMKQQGVKEGEYRIIEEHTNAKTASLREIELQQQYNYPIDRIQYWKTIRNQKPNKRKEIAAKIDWTPIKAKVDWTSVMKNRVIDYKKLSEDRLGKPIHSEEHIKKMYKPINQYDLQGNFIKQWESINSAMKQYKGDIQACCKGKQKISAGFIWKYAN